MRIILILLVVFAMTGTAAFADQAPPAAAPPATGQFLSFYNEGQVFLLNKEGGGAATFGWGPTWDYAYGNGIGAVADSGSIDQEWGFSYNSAKDKNGNSYGFSATIEFGGQFLLANAAVNSFYTYFKFGDVVRILLGAPRYDLGTGTLIEGAGTERFYNGTLRGDGKTTPGQYAAAVDVYPVQGLSITLAAFIPSVVNIANVFGSNWTGTNPPYGNGEFGGWQGIATAVNIDYLNNMGAAVTYAVADLGSFLVQYYRLKTYTKPDGTSDGSAIDRLDFVASITTWNNYLVKLQFDGNNIAPVAGSVAAPNFTCDVYLSARANLAPLTLTVASGLNQITTSVFSIAAEVQADYALGGAFSVGMRTGYQDANGIEFFDGGNGCWSGFEVWPYVKATFDNGSYIMAGFVYASGATPTPSLGYTSQSSVIAIPIQYVWAFM